MTSPERPTLSADLRDRAILPVAIPLLSLLVVLLLVVSFSRILLASPKDVATSVALAAGVGILLGASLMVAGGTSTRRVAPLLTLLAAGLIGGGAWAASVGYAPLHHEEAAGGEHATGPAHLEVQAADISFPQGDRTVASGQVEIAYVNIGVAPHTLVIEGVPDFKLAAQTEGARDTGTVTLEPGSYVFYCDVSGHREAGMEATLTVR